MFPESPPPSNNAPGDLAVAGAAQLREPCKGLTGVRPGTPISVDPSGTPTGRVDPDVRGEIAGKPVDGSAPGIVWANATAEANDVALVETVAITSINKSLRHPAPRMLRVDDS